MIEHLQTMLESDRVSVSGAVRKTGFFRHHKGEVYRLIGFTKDEGTGLTRVLYRSLKDFPNKEILPWDRPLAEFEANFKFINVRSQVHTQYIRHRAESWVQKQLDDGAFFAHVFDVKSTLGSRSSFCDNAEGIYYRCYAYFEETANEEDVDTNAAANRESED